MNEEKDPYFIQGQNRAKGMDYDGAIESFNRALQSNPENASAHLELAVLFDHKKKDPAAAIYHYEQHLKLRTNSPMAEMYRHQIVSCKRALAREVSYAVAPRELQEDLERASKTNALLEQRIAVLEAELRRRPQYITNWVTNIVQVQMPTFDPRHSSRLTQPAEIVQSTIQAAEPLPDLAEPEPPRSTPQARPQPQARQTATPAGRSAPASPRAASNATRRETAAPAPRSTARKTHTVRPGDTLEVVARRYGVSVSALKAANPGARRGARSGQQLVIPER